MLAQLQPPLLEQGSVQFILFVGMLVAVFIALWIAIAK